MLCGDEAGNDLEREEIALEMARRGVAGSILGKLLEGSTQRRQHAAARALLCYCRCVRGGVECRR